MIEQIQADNNNEINNTAQLPNAALKSQSVLAQFHATFTGEEIVDNTSEIQVLADDTTLVQFNNTQNITSDSSSHINADSFNNPGN